MQTQLHHANREVRRVRCSPAREYSIARLMLAGMLKKKAFRDATMHHIPKKCLQWPSTRTKLVARNAMWSNKPLIIYSHQVLQHPLGT